MNTARIAEATILLDMIQTINNKSYNIMNIKLMVVINNEVVQQIIHRGMVVPNYYNQDAAAEAYTIERIIQQYNINLQIDKVYRYYKSTRTFQ